jgi:TPR repeat protein
LAYHGDGQLANAIGMIYFQGSESVPRDLSQAYIYLSRDMSSQELLGLASAMKHDEVLQTIAVLQPLADHGDPIAQTGIAYLYLWNDAEGKTSEASKWFMKAANQGNIEAAKQLSWMYDHGRGVKSNHNEALKWRRTAAELGDANSQVQTAISSKSGASVEWYRRAAEQGNGQAQMKLGEMYEQGQNVKKSYPDAKMWYEMAASQGIAAAQINLASMYENGQGADKDIVQAYLWAKSAKLSGSDPGDLFTHISNEMTPESKAKAEQQWPQWIRSFLHYKRAISCGIDR